MRPSWRGASGSRWWSAWDGDLLSLARVSSASSTATGAWSSRRRTGRVRHGAPARSRPPASARARAMAARALPTVTRDGRRDSGARQRRDPDRGARRAGGGRRRRRPASHRAGLSRGAALADGRRAPPDARARADPAQRADGDGSPARFRRRQDAPLPSGSPRTRGRAPPGGSGRALLRSCEAILETGDATELRS